MKDHSLIRVSGVCKSFGHVEALKNIELDIYESEIVALVGDNGAGKSTFIKILSGMYKKDSGLIYYRNALVEINGPHEAAEKLGISTVYQDLALVEVQNVGVNIFLNIEPTLFGFFIKYNELYKNAESLIRNLKIDLPSVKVNVSELSGGQRQGVAIARALARGKSVFILDEPTAALGVEQQENVNNLILRLKREQKTVLLISHNLDHVFKVSDRIIVFRRGKKVAERAKNKTDKQEIVSLITGALDQ